MTKRKPISFFSSRWPHFGARCYILPKSFARQNDFCKALPKALQKALQNALQNSISKTAQNPSMKHLTAACLTVTLSALGPLFTSAFSPSNIATFAQRLDSPRLDSPPRGLTELSVLSRPLVAGVGIAGAAVVGKLVLDRPSRPYDENSVATEYGKLHKYHSTEMSHRDRGL